jgi:hypothetical protein
VERYNGCILVEDASGCQFQLHQYMRRRVLSTLRRYMLDTGELVSSRGDGSFVVVATGEKLVRVSAD